MITFWTSADASTIGKTIGLALTVMKPNIPPHKFTSFEFDKVVVPQFGEVVVACGTKPLDLLKKHGLAPKNRTLSSLREKPIPHVNGGHYFTTFDPALVANEPSTQELIAWDVRLVHRFLKTGSTAPIIGSYKWVGSYADLIARIEKQYADTGQKVNLSLDTETMGLYPWYPEKGIVSCSFTLEKSTAECLYTGPGEDPVPVSPQLREELVWLLTSPKIKLRLANGKYDMIWIAEKWGIECTNFVFDSLLVGALLDENRSNSLKLHAKIMTDMGGYDDKLHLTYDMGHMELVPLDDLKDYQGGDTDVTQQVADILRDELLQDPQLTEFYVTILHPAARAFEKLERRGVLVDQEAYAALGDELKITIGELEKEALSLLPGKLRIKHMDKIEAQLAAGKSPFTSAILADFFFGPSGLNLKPLMKTPTGLPSTAKAHLQMFLTNPHATQMVTALESMGSATKTLSTYVVGFMKHLRPDGRFHPSYMLFKGDFGEDDDEEGGTVTGRLSARDPAIQCCIGSTLVETDRGPVRIDTIVSDKGKGYKVLTHTGAYRKVIGVYENGVQPVFEVRLASGRMVTCTANHPFLTRRGWVRTDALEVGDVGFSRKSERFAARHVVQPRVQFVVCNEEPLLEPIEQGLPQVRGQRHNLRPDVGDVRGVSFRYGVEAYRDITGEEKQRRGLLEEQLQLGDPEAAAIEPICDQIIDAQRGDKNRGRVGQSSGNIKREATLSFECGSFDGGCFESEGATDRRSFQEDLVVSVTPAGCQETFDLTIDHCHSFVAGGVVVHNTVPKKSKWAKKLRKCFIAPPGKVILNADFSQGELRVVACVADEKNMIKAYKGGLDLHALTGSQLGGVSYSEFLQWKDSTDAKYAQLYEDLRTRAKAGNFGLLYGMGAEGFQRYAWASYGLKLTLAEAEKIRNDFFALYPGLTDYHKKYKALAGSQLQVRSPLGRIRHLPQIKSWDSSVRSKAERQSINSPIQSTLSDMMIWAIHIIESELPEYIEPVAMIHDACMFYVPEEKVKECAVAVTEVMSSLPFAKLGWYPVLDFPADAEFGINLAETKKLKL